jgi:co-chaperonin GroES (HSP10)
MKAALSKLRPIGSHILVADMNFGEQKSAGGIVLRSDDGKSEGVKPRWCRVVAVGPEQTSVKVGEWIYVEHGRWTRGVTVQDDEGNDVVIRRVEDISIMLSADEKPNEIEYGQYATPEQGSTHRPEDFVRY